MFKAQSVNQYLADFMTCPVSQPTSDPFPRLAIREREPDVPGSKAESEQTQPQHQPVTLNNASDLSRYRTIGPLLGYHWNYLCGVVFRVQLGLVLAFVSDYRGLGLGFR